MARKFEGNTLVLATHNKGKVTEMMHLLAPYNITVKSSLDLQLHEPEETGHTFTENAILKAQAAAKATGLPSLADDSGLAVDALNGEPGIYSARWAGEPRDFEKAMQRVNDELAENANRKGSFVCVLALAWPDSHIETFEGNVEGMLVWPPRGDQGFGYDPMFAPDGFSETFGEMPQDEKRAMSHRAQALKRLVTECFAD